MHPAHYPERQCKEAVANQEGMMYLCELVDLHPGPHASFSVKRTVDGRDRWEQDNPDWRQGIGNNDIIV